MKRLLVIAAVLLFVASCSQGTPEKPMEKAAPAGGGGKYLAKVNTVPITEDTVREELNALPLQVRTMLMEGGIEGFIDEIVKKELLYQEAQKKGIDKSDALKEKMEHFKKLMMIEILLESEVEKKVQVSEKEAKELYDKNKADFVITKGKKKEAVAFDKIKDLLMQRIASEKQKKVFETYVSELKNSSSIELNQEEIGHLANKAGAAKP